MSERKSKNPAAVSLGRLGARARAKAMTADQRSNQARHAVNSRWAGMSPADRTAWANEVWKKRRRNQKAKGGKR